MNFYHTFAPTELATSSNLVLNSSGRQLHILFCNLAKTIAIKSQYCIKYYYYYCLTIFIILYKLPKGF